MLKRNWNWRNNRFFVTFLSLVKLQLGGGYLPPLAYTYAPIEENKKDVCKFSARFLAFSNEISTVQKIVLSSSQGQSNFRGLEPSRPRTSKCVLEDVLEAKDVLEDSTSGFQSTWQTHKWETANSGVLNFLIFNCTSCTVNWGPMSIEHFRSWEDGVQVNCTLWTFYNYVFSCSWKLFVSISLTRIISVAKY